MRRYLFPLSLLAGVCLIFFGFIYFTHTRFVPVTAPPNPTVTIGDQSFELRPANYEWNYKAVIGRSGGYWHGKEATRRDMRQTEADTVVFDFGEMPPLRLTAVYFAEHGKPETPAEIENGVLTLQPGIWIYTVTAEWDESPRYSGIVNFSLCIDKQ